LITEGSPLIAFVNARSGFSSGIRKVTSPGFS